MTVSPAPVESGHAPVNGIEMYYELHAPSGGGLHGPDGGVPLVLLHGGGSTIGVTWSKILPLFAQTRRVIAVEEQGHGRTSDRDAPVTFESSADDVAALLRHLGVEQADVFGFSNGAHIALHVAIRHPALVRKLVFASAMTKRDGAYPWFWEFMQNADFSNMPQPLKDAFLEVTPDPQKLRTMHDKDAARMQNFQDIPDELLLGISAPTLVIAGDREAIKPEHAVEVARLIPDSRLLILPATHGDYLGEAIMTLEGSTYFEVTARLVEDFLAS